MDYLLDRYVFDFMPFDVSGETRKAIGQRALSVVMWADWLCKYQDPFKIFENHTSFLLGELLFFILCGLTFMHAYRHGNRYMFVWIGILIHALNVENLCYWIPDMDNFWQAQGILTLFGMRAPLYIILGIYHMFDYTAYVMVSRLRLPWWAEGPAVGLCAVMLDMPYDIMGIKEVWWTWHDTDPNIYDRMYWVPWNSYYFHASFACSFVWILNASRYYLVDVEYDWKKFPRELLCSFLAGMGAFWLGTIQFAVLYHPLHDMFGVHTEITTILFLATYIVIVITADRRNNNPAARTGNKYWFDELACAIALEYLFFMILVVIGNPVNVVSEGLHQTIGNCNDLQQVHTPTGMILQKKKYLCINNYDEKYFDFHCLPGGAVKMPEDGSPLEWYAICGTQYKNRAEYIAIIWGICILYGFIFYQIAAKSGTTPIVPVKRYQKVTVVRDKINSPETSRSTPSKKASSTTPDKKKTLTTPPIPRRIFSEPQSHKEFVAPSIPKYMTPRASSMIPETPSRTLRERRKISYKE
ncbi:unnamed protein product [Auanema sp. JU1783]|nr:unnamed protein product [Auanema sp. JU1783]